MTIEFSLNGRPVSVQARVVDRLSDMLANPFGLRRTRADCRIGTCGSCLVFMEDRLVPSCMIPAFRVRGLRVDTMEGLAQTEEGRDIVEAFAEEDQGGCGFCDVARFMTTLALLRVNGNPTDEIILEHMSAMRCRCMDPRATMEAVRRAAARRARRLYHRGGK